MGTDCALLPIRMTTVSFADLTHTGAGITANNNPLAVGYIAAYAKAHLGDAIDARLFKYPAALSRFLAHETPTIACFTNYMWNEGAVVRVRGLHQAAPSAHGGRDGGAELPDRRERTEGLPPATPRDRFLRRWRRGDPVPRLVRGAQGDRLRCRTVQTGRAPGAGRPLRHWRCDGGRRSGAANSRSEPDSFAVHDRPARRILRRQADPDDPDDARVPVCVHVLP